MALDLVRSEQVLEIRWEDGKHSRLSAQSLRLACPCAECRGELGVPGRLDRGEPLQDADYELIDATLVGRYALQLAFASGHSTGIYSFRYLRSLDGG